MIPVVCRMVPERIDYLPELIGHVPDLKLCLDRSRDPMENFLRALRSVEDSPAIHLEDDAILCSGFLAKANDVIRRHERQVIQFFSIRKEDSSVGSREDDFFSGAVCFYLPAGYSKLLADYSNRWPKRAANPNGVDIMLRYFLRERRETYWIQVPNLADHKVGTSTIDPSRSIFRQSLTFRP